ncbi:hypothetical protein UPYG_G00062540 [Umbra pygmaea]|uniref:Immunoglobulin domain-containing protein n=1 Tax=Umbra pygmaea TaxID=75934 RepID=A0ABD0X9Q0_UMBPY
MTWRTSGSVLVVLFCSMKGVLGTTCMNVTYTHQSISALIGSTVDLPCKYQHPDNNTVIEQKWFIQNQSYDAPRNLSSVPEYAGRLEYLGNNKTDCTLRIRDLRESDSAQYKFRFKTPFAEWGYSFPGTTLTVKGFLSPLSVVSWSFLDVLVVGSVLTAAALLLTIYCILKRKSTGESGSTAETQAVHPDSNSETYTALNMKNRAPEYETLTRV